MKSIIVLVIFIFFNLLSAKAFSYDLDEIRFVPIPKPMSVDNVIASSLTYEEGQTLFNFLKNLEHIPYDFIEDGCYTQAHEIAIILANASIQTGKVFILPKTGLLYPEQYRGIANPYFSGWRYHVAPFVVIEGKVAVLDPSLGDAPLSLKDWTQAQNKELNGVDFVFRDRKFLFHDSQYSPVESGIERLQMLSQKRQELGESEFWWQFEKGWL